jgi:HlyD family secretion protein
MKNLIKHPALIITVVAIAALGVGWYAYNSLTNNPHYDYTMPVIKDITENVTVTGQVKAADVVSLAFERAGKVFRIYVSVGDKVTTGQILVALSAQDALDDLSSAKASLALAQAQAGIQGTQLDNAKANLSQAQVSLLDKIQSAYIVVDDAVRTQAGQFFSDPTDNPQLNILVPNRQLTVALPSERRALETALVDWNLEITQAASASASATNNWDALSSHARQNILLARQFLDDCAAALNIAVINQPVLQTSIPSWKVAITTSRANVSAVLISLSTADSQLTAAESAYTLAGQQVQSGVGVAVSVSQAQVDQAQVAVQRAQSALSKTVLRAPFDGVITRVDAKTGQTVAIGVSAVGMISSAHYQIEGYVSEADAAKIQSGQTANVTLDAYGSSVLFPVKVVLVDPAETVQNGVSSYKVTFEFITDDARVKSGMTANVSVFIASKKGVLTVPESAVVRRGAEEFVLVATGGNAAAVLTKVTTGLRDDDGSVEILSGITASSSIVSLAGTK